MDDNDIFKLKPPDWCFTGDCPGLLPVVVCEFCEQRVGGFFRLPLVPAEPFKKWIFKHDTFPYPELTWREFQEIQAIARPYLRHGAEIAPMTSLGPFSMKHLGHPHAILKDIEFAEPGGFLFSQRLLRLLRDQGMELPSQPFTLLDRKERPKEFGLIQIEAFPVRYHSRTLKEDKLRICGVCGAIWPENLFVTPSPFSFFERTHQRIVGEFFTIGPDGGAVYLSRRAFESLSQINPLGFSAQLVGRWAD